MFVQTSCKHGKTHCAHFVKAPRASPPPGGLAALAWGQRRVGAAEGGPFPLVSVGSGPQAGGLQLGPTLAPRSCFQLRLGAWSPPERQLRPHPASAHPHAMAFLQLGKRRVGINCTSLAFHKSHLASPQRATGTTGPLPGTTRGRARASL